MVEFAKDFELPFVKKEQVSKDAYTFFFDRSKEQDFDFLPGQFIRMSLDILQPDERGSSRTLSISSSPLDKNYLTVTVRIIKSAFKKTLFGLNPGTKVKFFGPNGRFVFDENDIAPRIFLAGGIGITPFHSMLLYAVEKKSLTPLTLFASFSTTDDFVFYDELERIAKLSQQIKIVYTVTKPDEINSVWPGETGRISDGLVKKYAPNFMHSQFYISGPPLMVDSMLGMVEGIGISEEQVKKEKFVGY